MIMRNRTDNRKTLIFGIDGGTWDVLDSLIERGFMPHLARLRAEGAWGDLMSIVPVNSAAAWSSILTGLSPANHKVFDFFAWNPETQSRTTVNSTWIPRPTMLDLMGEAGNVLALKIPMTYPPWQINGKMVSGLPSPDDEAAFTYPKEIATELNGLIERGSASRSWEQEGDNRHVILDQMEAAHRVLEKMSDHLLKDNQTDICFVVARDVDELQHFFWDSLNGNDQYGYLPRLEKYFTSIDRYLGRMLDWAGVDARVIVLSDHGFGPADNIWHLNGWLESKGFLSIKQDFQSPGKSHNITFAVRVNFALRRRLRKQLNRFGIEAKWLEQSLQRIKLRSQSHTDLQGIDWGSTLVYAGNGGEEWLSLHINLKGRDPHGVVTPEQYYNVREELRRLLLENAEPRVLEVHHSEDIYDIKDPRSSAIPDLLVQTVEGNVKSDFALNPSAVFEQSKFVKGCHRQRGMFLLYGPDVNQSYGNASLLDMPATILAWLGIPVPKHFEGRALIEFIEALNGETQKEDTDTTEAVPVFFSEEEESGVRKKLESLGYL